MRQIITQPSWSGSSNGNGNARSLQRDGETGLNTMETSSSRGETDSSFEVPGANTNSNFRDRHAYSKSTPPTKSRRKSNNNNGSMQFVPADHQTDNNKFVGTPETSWDALANDSEMYSSKGNKSVVAGSVVTPSPPSARRPAGRPSARRSEGRHMNFSNKSRQQQQQRSEGTTSISAVSSSVDDGSRSAGGSKIGRLASMFSSRAVPVVVPLQASTPGKQKAVQSSPPGSESSTGYIGWPGTQDEQGVTVQAESSYEESDVSAGNHGSSSPTDLEQEKIHRLEMLAEHSQSPYTPHKQMQMMEASGYGENEDTMSGTSSAYFNPGEVQAIRKGSAEQFFGSSNQNKNRLAAATVMRRCLNSSMTRPRQEQPPQALTEERLAMKDRLTAPSRNFNIGAAAGYRGLLDRTQDVPNLIDDTSSDCTSAITSLTDRQSKANEYEYNKSTPAESPSLPSSNYKQQRQAQREHQHVSTIDEEDGNEGLLGATPRTSMNKLNLALLGGGLTTIQTTTGDFTNRKTASDFDETLTNSDCDQYGFAKIPAFHEMVSAGMSQHDRSLTLQSLQFATQQSHQPRFRPRTKDKSDQFDFVSGNYRATNAVDDFSQYYIYPDQMQILVKKFRKMSVARCQYFDYEDLEREEDATKAFALSEMRSRIMEKDIERGLERRGGTTVVDDIVMTSYYKAALRVRDAVIVAKAWHDGATPQDIVNTANLTRRDERSYYIPRLETSAKGASKYTWEEVAWVDDNDLSQYRCHSLGPRHLKGAEMFTIGDCQSILLKLSNERCQELRAELNEATANQIENEGIMKEEGETFDGMMTEAEMTYLTSMEGVKAISQKLVLAEKSFELVKNRIEKLVAKYEALLVHFENEAESVAPSSVFSYESSCYSEDYSFAAAKQREDEVLARRAQRAELRAELVARESLLSNQKNRSSIRKEKVEEVNNLKARIADLQSEASTAFTNRDRSVVLARTIARNNSGEAGGRSYNRTKIDDIKQRFRNRSAAKFQFNSVKKSDDSPTKQTSLNHRPGEIINNNVGNSFHRTVGEEMFQHLDFYERSLRAVQRPR
jgi:hypothetical protein